MNVEALPAGEHFKMVNAFHATRAKT